ncbi:ATP-binding cassette domain-containing protein [Methanoregula sp.]|uniref:ATP-binding cassette domain-containing protein n=1 Tax=Methanoregula sp. TaxID=2052170 RepID=UPI00356ABBFB
MRLVLDHLTASYPRWSLAANGVFSPGIHLVSGDVGSGKSTLSLMMAGLLMPESGSVIREDITWTLLSFQFPEFHITGLSVAEECRSWDLDPDAVIRAAGIDVTGETPALSLSRGELKRLHLACVLSRKYDLLLLDEPFSSLDCPGKEWVCRQLSNRTEGITVIFTHEQSIFPRIDHIWEIVGGNLIDCGDMPGAVVRWQHAPALVKNLIRAGRIPLALTPEGIREAACRTRG